MQSTAIPGFARRVAAEVRASLARKGMGKADLGRVLGVSAPTAAARWAGTYPYTLDELERIALALDVSILSLVSPPEPPESAAS